MYKHFRMEYLKFTLMPSFNMWHDLQKTKTFSKGFINTTSLSSAIVYGCFEHHTAHYVSITFGINGLIVGHTLKGQS